MQAVGDLDGDGFEDLAWSSNGSVYSEELGLLWISYGEGGGDFRGSGPGYPLSYDSYQDVVIAPPGATPYGGFAAVGALVYLYVNNHGDRYDLSLYDLRSPEAVAADLPSAGACSIAWDPASPPHAPELAVAYGETWTVLRGAADAPVDTTSYWVDVRLLEPVFTGGPPQPCGAVAWTDADGDGDSDLLVAPANAPVQLWQRDGDTFTWTWVSRDVECATWCRLAVGDIDLDGREDFVISGAEYDIGSNDVNDRVAVYVNDRDRPGRYAMAWALGGFWRGVAVRDRDGDGDLDLAVGGSVLAVFDNVELPPRPEDPNYPGATGTP